MRSGSRTDRARRRPGALAVALPLLGAFAGCAAPPPMAAPPPPAPKHAVVLLADPDGTVGRVVVTNEAGSQTLDAAGSATRILDARTAPGAPAPMPAAEVEETFGAALAAQPAPPLHFTLYFENGSVELTPASRGEVAAIVAAIRERASVDTSVVGHTDTSGDAGRNRELALRRAQAVASLLGAAGADPAVLEITSHGEANPLVPTGDNVPEPKNRRVEVTVR